MDKKKIIDYLIESVRSELKKMEEAYESSKSLTMGDDMKAESKWDTRSIEAGQLAGAQAKRIEELKLELKLLEEIPTGPFSEGDEVAIGALVGIEHNGLLRRYFISSTAGGSMVKLGDEAILVISVFSPIGSEVIGLSVGDEFELETSRETRTYKVMSLA